MMPEGRLEIGGTIPAMLVFADIIDSSKYSAVLGRVEYAKRLLMFQELFITLGNKYFPIPSNKAEAFREINARGDEGIVFIACTGQDFSELIFHAIEFLYHLKGLLRYGYGEIEEDVASPRQIGLGAGIHIGTVAYATTIENGRSIIKHIEGFSINYAKRVESCSRVGRYSHIFLSKAAAKYIEDKPIILSCTKASMKGIEDNAEVYEVQSGLFNGLKLDINGNDFDKGLVEEIERIASLPRKIDEPWVKALVTSILDYLLSETPIVKRKVEYRQSQLRLAWHSSIEDDPILLYLRAREFEEKKQYTQQIRYLKQLYQDHPNFIHAKKRLIRACWAITKNKSEKNELVFARDLASEFLKNFPQLLSEEDGKEFQKIVKATQVKSKTRKNKI